MSYGEYTNAEIEHRSLCRTIRDQKVKLDQIERENRKCLEALKEIMKEWDDCNSILYFANQALNIAKQTLEEIK